MNFQNVFARRLWDVLNGNPVPVLPTQYPFLASITYYISTLFLSRVLLSILIQLSRKRSSIQICSIDFLFAFSTCACSLENAMVGYYYGPFAYAAVVFLLGLWYCYMTPIEINSSPVNNCADLAKTWSLHGVLRYSDGHRFLIRTVSQILGARLSYSYARLWWYMELTTRHGYRFLSPSCKTDLNVSLSNGMAIEFVGTFFLMIVCYVLSKISISSFASHSINSFIGVVLTMMGLPHTGMYMNPINASNQTLNCKGLSAFNHFLIYWMAPLIAGFSSQYICMHYTVITKTFYIKSNPVDELDKDRNALNNNETDEWETEHNLKHKHYDTRKRLPSNR